MLSAKLDDGWTTLVDFYLNSFLLFRRTYLLNEKLIKKLLRKLFGKRKRTNATLRVL